VQLLGNWQLHFFTMKQEVPIPTAHLFSKLDAMLLELLRSLSNEEWYKPTIAKKWLVKDIAAHLLDGNIRTLSLSRDGLTLTPVEPVRNYSELVNYLNELNAVWVNASRRVSPRLLTEFLEITGKEFCSYMESLDPWDKAMFSVAWAGEEVSSNWFHIAREYTEKFLHQQQIRDAVGKPGLITHELFHPFIDTFMQALPYTYRHMILDEGTTLQVQITADAGGDWYLTRKNEGWILNKTRAGNPAAVLAIDPDTAWRLFSKGISPEQAREKVVIRGDEQLALPALEMVSVMA
jgi:hypothetical protein